MGASTQWPSYLLTRTMSSEKVTLSILRNSRVQAKDSYLEGDSDRVHHGEGWVKPNVTKNR